MRQAQQEKKREYDIMQQQMAKLARTIETQTALLNETAMCKEEIDRLDEDATIYKLTGPILVKQDLEMSKSNVQTRHDFIKKQLTTLESNMQAKNKEVEALTDELRALFTKVKEAEAAQQARGE